MTPAERLKEIEKRYTGEDAVKDYKCQICGTDTDDRVWLINRVRGLTKELQIISMADCFESHAIRARKALEEE